MNVLFFNSKVENFIQSLEARTLARVLRKLDLLEMFGQKLGMPHSRKINKTLFELRIRGEREIRIFYTYRKERAILLHAFIKKSQRLPLHEIRLAQSRLKTIDKL